MSETPKALISSAVAATGVHREHAKPDKIEDLPKFIAISYCMFNDSLSAVNLIQF